MALMMNGQGNRVKKSHWLLSLRMLNVIKLSKITVNRHSCGGGNLMREMISFRKIPAFAGMTAFLDEYFKCFFG